MQPTAGARSLAGDGGTISTLRTNAFASLSCIESKKGARKPNSPLSRSRAAPASLNCSTKPRVRLKCSESVCLRDAGWRNAASSSFLRASSEKMSVRSTTSGVAASAVVYGTSKLYSESCRATSRTMKTMVPECERRRSEVSGVAVCVLVRFGGGGLRPKALGGMLPATKGVFHYQYPCLARRRRHDDKSSIT